MVTFWYRFEWVYAWSKEDCRVNSYKPSLNYKLHQPTTKNTLPLYCTISSKCSGVVCTLLLLFYTLTHESHGSGTLRKHVHVYKWNREWPRPKKCHMCTVRAHMKSPPPTHTKTTPTLLTDHTALRRLLSYFTDHGEEADPARSPYNMVKRPSIHSCFRPFRAAFSCQCCQSLQLV